MSRFRFKHFDFATGEVVAILHDVFVTMGILVMLGRQLDLLVVTALLTIAGYSVVARSSFMIASARTCSSSGAKSLGGIINESNNQMFMADHRSDLCL